MKKKRKPLKNEQFKNEPFYDDGRTVANMNVDGMPWYDGKTEEIKKLNKSQSELPELDRKGKNALMWGVVLAALLIGLVFAGAMFLFILFCVKVWFA